MRLFRSLLVLVTVLVTVGLPGPHAWAVPYPPPLAAGHPT